MQTKSRSTDFRLLRDERENAGSEDFAVDVGISRTPNPDEETEVLSSLAYHVMCSQVIWQFVLQPRFK